MKDLGTWLKGQNGAPPSRTHTAAGGMALPAWRNCLSFYGLKSGSRQSLPPAGPAAARIGLRATPVQNRASQIDAERFSQQGFALMKARRGVKNIEETETVLVMCLVP
jgi:hypothetical protein